MEVSEILQLMDGMAKNRIALLEFGGLKLAASPPERGMSQPPAASGLMPPQLPQAPTPVDMDPVKAMAAARIEAARLAEQRLALSQAQTAASRKRAAKGGIGPRDTGSLVKDVFETAKKSARNKPRS